MGLLGIGYWFEMDSSSCLAVEVSKNRKPIDESERTTMPEDGLIDGQTRPVVMLHLADPAADIWPGISASGAQ